MKDRVAVIGVGCTKFGERYDRGYEELICDAAFAAYDDATLEQVWKMNVGTGLNAPPISFEAGGKQYVAILSGLSRQSKGRLVLTPELREMRNQTMLFVFGL